MTDERTLDAWGRLHDMKKSIFNWPDWQTIKIPKQAKSPVRLDSEISEREVLHVTLADGEMNVLQDMQLRIMAWKGRSNFDVTATLEVETNGWTCIARMEFWPSSPHTNTFWRKLSQPARIVGSHHHRFHDNRRLGAIAFKPVGNLPSAIQFDDEPSSFRDILALIEREWRIDGASGLALPERQGRLW